MRMIIKNKFFHILVLVVALFQSGMPSAYAVDATSILGKGSDTIKEYFNTSAGVAVIAAIGTVYSGVLYKQAAKQEEDSKNNVKKIDKLIASYKDSTVNTCAAGRDDLSVPYCYCYLATGAKNTNRSNSTTCTTLWAKNDYVLTSTAKDYSTGTYSADVSGCVTTSGTFDETCQCKKLVDSSGNNACKKETTVTLQDDNASTSIATTTGLKDLLSYTSDATNGTLASNLLSTGTLTANAIKARKIADQLATKLPANTIPKLDESNVGKYAEAAIGSKNIQASMAANKSGSAMNVSSARSGTTPVMETALQKAQEKVGIEVVGSGKGTASTKDNKKAGFNLNLGDVSSSGNGQVVQEFADTNKNYKYKNSDIVTDKGASLFEVISNRYIQSGLKRLFDDVK
jgi:hypothetical protein